MPAGSIRRLVPGRLDLDLFAGQAWITLIPFLIAESRPAGVPPVLATRLLETNLRTYVRGPDGEPGIYFWSLEASSVMAVLGARLFYGLPYFPATMSMRKDGPRVDYASRRRLGRPAQLLVTWTVGEPIGLAAAGTRDHFLIERYTLYVARWGQIHRARVRHPPYLLHHARVDTLTESLVSAAGLGAPAGPPLCHYSPGVDVDIFWPARVPPPRPA